MNETFITCKNLSKKFKNANVVDEITYSFEKSCFYAIMGHSGSGKSTFLHLLGLLEKADKGEILINDKNILKASEVEKAKFREKYFGFIFQSCFLNTNFDITENVMLPMLLNRNIKDAKKEAEKLLDKVGLSDRKNYFPKKLSGGEQQRAAIARALANNPECILADEPTGNLDEENEIKIFEMLRDLSHKQNKCIICISHSDRIKDYADKILCYRNGGFIK